MIGHEGVATALTRLLEGRGEAVARQVEQEKGLQPGTIEVPTRENIHPVFVDTVAKGRYPAWMVVAEDTPIRRTAQVLSHDGLRDEVQWTYPFIVVSYVAGKDLYDLGLKRYRLMEVVRTILIQAKCIVKTPTERATIVLDDMQEIVGGAAQDDNNTVLMEAQNSFHVHSIEVTPAAQKPWGPLASVELGESLERP